jgi:glycosyltransferase involved in cell wall biosynthesis
MTNVDSNYLKNLNSKIKTCVIPNGVAADIFLPLNIDSKFPADICFVAKLMGSNLSNLERFLLEAWIKIHSNFPEIKFHVVGRISLDAKPLIALSNSIGGVVFHDYVEKLSDVYRLCSIAVVPVDKNCGIINKAIEAMGAGLAVVGFYKTFAGIPHARNDKSCVIVENYDQMERQISLLYNNIDRLNRIRIEGQKIANQYYRWSVQKPKYNRLYNNAKWLAYENFAK